MEKRTFSRIGWTTVLFTIVGFPVIFLISLFIDFESETGYSTYSFTAQILFYAEILGLVVLMFRKLPKMPDMPKHRMYFSDFAFVFFISFSFLYFGALIGGFANEWLAALVDGVPVNPIEEMSDSIPLWLNLLLDLIMAPLFEELIFRKYVLDVLRPFGDRTACIVCGVLFGIFHMNLDQFFYAALLGILFSYVMLRTNNLWYTISLHALVNLVGTQIVPGIYGYFEKISDNADSIINWCLYLIVIAGLVLFGFKCRKLIFNPPYFSFSMPVNFRTIVFNSGFIAMIVLFIIESISATRPSWLY